MEGSDTTMYMAAVFSNQPSVLHLLHLIDCLLMWFMFYCLGRAEKYTREALLDIALLPLSRKEPKDWENIMTLSIAKKVYNVENDSSEDVFCLIEKLYISKNIGKSVP